MVIEFISTSGMREDNGKHQEEGYLEFEWVLLGT